MTMKKQKFEHQLDVMEKLSFSLIIIMVLQFPLKQRGSLRHSFWLLMY